MIRYLEGRLVEQSETSVVVVTHGIGYLVHTNTTHQQLVIDQTVAYHTYLAVRETALDLYGFQEPRELQYFELLLSVPKIGPKSALQLLAQTDPDIIATAVLTNDSDHLHKLSGIGKKTAANIVTALQGKIDNLEVLVANKSTSSLTSTQIDAIDALLTLGYEEKAARALVSKLDASLSTKDLIQSVLRNGAP
jgi:Holliday junction DNA helicase RuvA